MVISECGLRLMRNLSGLAGPLFPIDTISKFLSDQYSTSTQYLGLLCEGVIIFGGHYMFPTEHNMLELVAIWLTIRYIAYQKSRTGNVDGQAWATYFISRYSTTFFTEREVRIGALYFWIVFGFFPKSMLIGMMGLLNLQIVIALYVYWMLSIGIMSPHASQLHKFDLQKHKFQN